MLIILDRDGVINEDSDAYIKNVDEMLPIPSSLQAIAALNRAGHSVVVATNQSGLARGLYSEATLKQIHNKLEDALALVGGELAGIFYCPHHPDVDCECRKPKPGLLLQIADQFKVDLQNCLMVGDALRDIQAAQAVDCPAVLVRTGKGLRTLAQKPDLGGAQVFDDLAAVVEWLLA